MAGVITQDERRVAEDAARVLASPVFRAANRHLEDTLVEAWKSGRTTEAREAVWNELQALLKMRAELIQRLETVAFKDEKDGPIRRLVHKVNQLWKRGE